MHPSIWWVVVGIALIALEMATGTFFALCLGIAALLTAAFGYYVEEDVYQYSFFAASAVILTLLSRPLAARFSRSPSRPSNIDALVGQKGLVEKLADGKKGTGYVKVNGEVWRFETEEGAPLKVGHEVTVLSVRGNTLRVKAGP